MPGRASDSIQDVSCVYQILSPNHQLLSCVHRKPVLIFFFFFTSMSLYELYGNKIPW